MDPQYIGIDHHKASLLPWALSAAGTRLWDRRFERTPAGLAAFLTRGVATAHVAVEATGPTWAFVDAIQPQVAHVCVVDTRKTKLKAGFAAKTDRLDAQRLADALRRASVVSIYIPPPAIRELREICRGRHHLVRVRAKLMQSIRALLLRHDAGDPPTTRLVSPRALAWLKQVRLPGETQTVLRRLIHALEAIDDEATAADAVVRVRAAADPIAAALQTLAGIGPVVALTLHAEIGAIERFPDWTRLAVMPGWCRAWRPVPAACAPDALRGTDRRGSGGRSSKPRSMR